MIHRIMRGTRPSGRTLMAACCCIGAGSWCLVTCPMGTGDLEALRAVRSEQGRRGEGKKVKKSPAPVTTVCQPG